MSSTVYQRVNLERLGAGAATLAEAEQTRMGVRWLVIPLSILLCAGQSVLTLVASNTYGIIPTSTMIPVIAMVLLFLAVLGANPLLRLNRGRALGTAAVIMVVGELLTRYALTRLLDANYQPILDNLSYLPRAIGFIAIFLALLRLVGFRPFNRAELTCVFAAMMVTAGIATFGLTEQLIPLIATPFNPEWNTPDRGWGDPLLLRLRPELYLHNAESIAMFRRGMPAPANLDWAAYLAHCKMVFFQIPWGEWIKPLGYWLILVSGCYGLFYCLTYVVLGYWSDREKLIFPLAKLSESLLPDEKSNGRVPALMRGSGFWLGFAVSFLLLAWNGAAEMRWVSGGLGPITLGMRAGPFAALVSGGPLEGLIGGESSLAFLIIFTAIGISFLLPLEISFSAWFYFLVGKAIIFSHVWLGYGRNGNDYPSDWLWLNNPVSAQGGGGLVIFSAVSLYRCLKDYARLAAGRTIGDRIRLGLPVIGLAFFMLVVTLWVSWNRIGFFWALAFVVVLTLLTIGLMRIVAEGGIYWFQSNTSFFHIYKMLGLGKYLAPSLLGPLIPIYSILFLDTKTFLAPNMLNAASMNKTVGGGGRSGRLKFHLNILLCILVSVVVSLGFAIFLAHLRGAQQEQSWFYSAGPQGIMDTARDASKAVSDFNGVTTFWWIFGGCSVALSLYLRTWIFWFPHPIGYIMLINQLMGQLWFSFFLGWICKKIAVGYGGKATFEKIREFFLGLIMGELTAIVLAMVISMLVRGVAIGSITLNRYMTRASNKLNPGLPLQRQAFGTPSCGPSFDMPHRADNSLRPFGWAGLLMELPESFRLIRTDGAAHRGSLVLADDDRTRLHVSWAAVSRRRFNAERFVRRQLARAAGKRRRDALDKFISIEHESFRPLLMDTDDGAGIDRCVGYCRPRRASSSGFIIAPKVVRRTVFEGAKESWPPRAISRSINPPAGLSLRQLHRAGRLRLSQRCTQPRRHARQSRRPPLRTLRPGCGHPPCLPRNPRLHPAAARSLAPRLAPGVSKTHRTGGIGVGGLLGRGEAGFAEESTLRGPMLVTNARARFGPRLQHWRMAPCARLCTLHDQAADRIVTLYAAARPERVGPLIDELLAGLHWAADNDGIIRS